MPNPTLLTITGQVQRPLQLTFEDLAAIESKYQINDVSRIDPNRKGGAVRLVGLLEMAGSRPTATYLGLHSSTDDFHASIPLAPVVERAMLIYRLDDQPLTADSGGPVRFYISDFAACHTDEIDECANVKFVDHIELTTQKGVDNRPQDDEEHEKLHQSEDGETPSRDK